MPGLRVAHLLHDRKVQAHRGHTASARFTSSPSARQVASNLLELGHSAGYRLNTEPARWEGNKLNRLESAGAAPSPTPEIKNWNSHMESPSPCVS